MLKCSCRRTGLLPGSSQYVSHRLYLKGFHDSHAAAGKDADPALVTEIELNTDSGYAATRKLVRDRKHPEALIITGGRASLGSLKALRELELNVPRDVGVRPWMERVKRHLRMLRRNGYTLGKCRIAAERWN